MKSDIVSLKPYADLAALKACLDEWLDRTRDNSWNVSEAMRQYGGPLLTPEMLAMKEEYWLGMYQRAEAALPRLLQDNSGLDADVLAEIAHDLCPGDSVHHEGMLPRIIRDRAFHLDKCPVLMAAIIAHSWPVGKRFHPLLPHPGEVDATTYCFVADCLARDLRRVEPLQVLTGEDAAFYRSLPNKMIAYRGGLGDKTEFGLSWTLSREMAEWFAGRWRGMSEADGEEPRLFAAEVHKSDVLLAFAGEKEVVIEAGLYCETWELECRPRRERPF